MTTAVLWYIPAVLRSKRERTRTIPSSFARAPYVSVDGPGTGSARSQSEASSLWQKYTELWSSCRTTSCAPSLAHSLIFPLSFSILAAMSVPQDCCTIPTFSMLPIILTSMRQIKLKNQQLNGFKEAFRILHGNAVKGTVSGQERHAVYHFHFPVRESLLKTLPGDFIFR